MQLILISDAEKKIDIKSQLVPTPTGARLQNAVKRFGLFFALAIALIFVPVLHFILVPLFLIISLIAFFKGFDLRYEIVQPETPLCVKCAAPMILPRFVASSGRLRCATCRAQYRLEDVRSVDSGASSNSTQAQH